MVHFTGSDITLFVIGFFLPPLHAKNILVADHPSFSSERHKPAQDTKKTNNAAHFLSLLPFAVYILVLIVHFQLKTRSLNSCAQFHPLVACLPYSLGLTLLGHVPGIVYAWWIIYTNREDPRTRRRINHGGQNSVDRRSYLAVAQQGHADSPPSSGGAIVHAPHSHDPQVQVHSGGQSQTHTTVDKSQEQQHPGLPHQNSSTRTITTTTTTRTSSNGGPPQTIQTIITSQNGEVIDKKVVVVDKKDTPPAY
ncbi:hypothetical protein K457DRAFT_1822618 [Linnemannia elongata AG-77]|uniref:Uncharacterized protein n=1 Tax=Linnemannia elongata AG-77 TaxID=1314771 RepID=A0A197JL24_9FUNG|nr:hypothetical protein K457DRAFT_1822618 [Linnemannia elongata AG-77]